MAAPLTGIVVARSSPLGGGAPALAVGSEVVARVVASGAGRATLSLASALVEATTTVPLEPGARIALRVESAQEGKVTLRLLPQPQQAAQPEAAPELYAKSLVAAAGRQLAARGAPPGETTSLAARFLGGEAEPLARLRDLASTRPPLRALLAAAARGAVFGDRAQLRAALSQLGLDHERRALAGDAAPDAKSELGAEAPLVSAQQLLLTRDPSAPAPVVLFLPLPGGEARVTIEAGGPKGEADAFQIHVELEFARLGPLGVQLVGHRAAASVSVQSEDADVADALLEGAPELEAALRDALGRPVQVAVARRRPECAPCPVGEVDVRG
jgi:hypothetical protein